MKTTFKVLISIVAVLFALSAVLFFFAYSSGAIGLSLRQLDKEAANISFATEQMKSVRVVDDNLCVRLLYNEALGDYEYFIYVNRDGFSFGYFFVQGGSDAKIKDDVALFEYEDKIILVSLNKVGVAEIHHDGIQHSSKYYKDPAEPFLEVISPADNPETITLYDSDGEIIPLIP